MDFHDEETSEVLLLFGLSIESVFSDFDLVRQE